MVQVNATAPQVSSNLFEGSAAAIQLIEGAVVLEGSARYDKVGARHHLVRISPRLQGGGLP